LVKLKYVDKAFINNALATVIDVSEPDSVRISQSSTYTPPHSPASRRRGAGVGQITVHQASAVLTTPTDVTLLLQVGGGVPQKTPVLSDTAQWPDLGFVFDLGTFSDSLHVTLLLPNDKPLATGELSLKPLESAGEGGKARETHKVKLIASTTKTELGTCSLEISLAS